MILAGDIGGTKTNLGLFDVAGGALTPRHQQSFPSNRFSRLESIIDAFIKGRLSSLLEAIPVRVILNDKTGAAGAGPGRHETKRSPAPGRRKTSRAPAVRLTA